jgi:hypothetical protein
MLLAGGLMIISIVTKLMDPGGKMASPRPFLRIAVVFALLGMALLVVAHATKPTGTGDYGMAAMQLLHR